MLVMHLSIALKYGLGLGLFEVDLSFQILPKELAQESESDIVICLQTRI